jgi:tripartite-type tricarboxylate transporter receptor subunit TctC
MLPRIVSTHDLVRKVMQLLGIMTFFGASSPSEKSCNFSGSCSSIRNSAGRRGAFLALPSNNVSIEQGAFWMSSARRFLINGFATVLLGAALSSHLSARAASPDFYAGKTIDVVIGYGAGGGYDIYARLLATHLGAHLPGNPRVVPQNMPGAGSLNAIAYTASIAPRDGTEIATFSRSMPIYPLLFGARYDGSKLDYVGSITTDTSVCITWRASKIRTWQDLLSMSSVFGGEGKGADPDVFATLLRQEFGAKIKLVTGYAGTADMTLAMQRGEIDGMCGISYSTLRSAHADWLRDKDINIVVQAALTKDPALPDVPLLIDQASQEKQRQIIKLAVAPSAMARPFAMPPGVPDERLLAVRRAFDATMEDPAFLADAKKSNLDVGPLSGAKLEALVKELYTTPKNVVEEASRAMGGGN